MLFSSSFSGRADDPTSFTTAASPATATTTAAPCGKLVKVWLMALLRAKPDYCRLRRVVALFKPMVMRSLKNASIEADNGSNVDYNSTNIII